MEKKKRKRSTPAVLHALAAASALLPFSYVTSISFPLFPPSSCSCSPLRLWLLFLAAMNWRLFPFYFTLNPLRRSVGLGQVHFPAPSRFCSVDPLPLPAIFLGVPISGLSLYLLLLDSCGLSCVIGSCCRPRSSRISHLCCRAGLRNPSHLVLSFYVRRYFRPISFFEIFPGMQFLTARMRTSRPHEFRST